MIVSALAYIADAVILGSYAVAVAKSNRIGWFHWANGVGAIPIAVTEVAVHAWPALILTAAFGVIGWIGALSPRRED